MNNLDRVRELVAEGIADALNYMASFSPDSFDQAALYDAWQTFVGTFGDPQ